MPSPFGGAYLACQALMPQRGALPCPLMPLQSGVSLKRCFYGYSSFVAVGALHFHSFLATITPAIKVAAILITRN